MAQSPLLSTCPYTEGRSEDCVDPPHRGELSMDLPSLRDEPGSLHPQNTRRVYLFFFFFFFYIKTKSCFVLSLSIQQRDGQRTVWTQLTAVNCPWTSLHSEMSLALFTPTVCRSCSCRTDAVFSRWRNWASVQHNNRHIIIIIIIILFL